MELEFLKDKGFNIVRVSKFIHNIRYVNEHGRLMHYKYNERIDLLTDLAYKENYVYGMFKLKYMIGENNMLFGADLSRASAFKFVIAPYLTRKGCKVIEMVDKELYVIVFDGGKECIIYNPISDSYQYKDKIIKGIRKCEF